MIQISKTSRWFKFSKQKKFPYEKDEFVCVDWTFFNETT